MVQIFTKSKSLVCEDLDGWPPVKGLYHSAFLHTILSTIPV